MIVDEEYRPAEILLVEDARGDVRLIEEAFREQQIDVNLHVVVDGESALSFLSHEGRFADAPHPDIVILDLNLPRKSGRAVLREIKSGARFAHLKRTPVIILTTSNHEEDVVDCYENFASSYILKPMKIEKYYEIVEEINKYWFATVKLPSS